MRKRLIVLVSLTACLAGRPVLPGGSAHAQIAVIVNQMNPVNDIDLTRLSRLYSGVLTRFVDTFQVSLGEWVPSRSRFYQKVLNLDETSVSRMWIGHVFSGGAGIPPAAFRDANAAIDFVRKRRGAICFIPMEAVTGDVKVLTIGGLGPSSPTYPLR